MQLILQGRCWRYLAQSATFFCCGSFEVNTVSFILLRLFKLGQKTITTKKKQHFNTYANFPVRPKSVESWNTLYKWRLTLFHSNRTRVHLIILGYLTPNKSKKKTDLYHNFLSLIHLFLSPPSLRRIQFAEKISLLLLHLFRHTALTSDEHDCNSSHNMRCENIRIRQG